MKRFFFDKYKFLFVDSTIPNVKECLDIIANEEILLKEDININNTKSNKDIFGIYLARKENLEKSQDITDFNFLLSRLKEMELDLPVKSLIIVASANSYTIFYDGKNESIVAILKSNELNIEKINQLNKVYIDKGISVNYSRYFKGELIEIIKFGSSKSS
jgi:hypothetical protein